MLFDMFRRRGAHASPSPVHNTPYRQSPSSSSSSPFQSPSRRNASSPIAAATATDYPPRLTTNPEPNNSIVKSTTPSPPALSRKEYIRALEARMERMERVSTSSFYHSYAGEFDVSFLLFSFLEHVQYILFNYISLPILVLLSHEIL